MGLSISGNVMKGFMIFTNVLTFLLGGAILTVGIWLKVAKGDYDSISSYDYMTPSNIAIVIGAFVMLVCFIGCCGALIENRCLLLLYFFLMMLVIIGEVITATFVYTKRTDIENNLAIDFKKSIMEKYGRDNYKHTTTVIDRFQDDFNCCGYNTYLDWFNSYYTNSTNQIPKSCCMDQYEDDNTVCGPGSNAKGIEPYNIKGCYDEVLKFLKNNMLIIGTVAISVAAVQIILSMVSIMLYMSISKDQTDLYA